MSQDKVVLLRQSIAAAESSLKTAKQLLSEIESGGMKPSAKDLPGVTGIFDGLQMVTEKGETFPVPSNYASKSLLVVGDTLKLVDENGEKRFKQIEHVKRLKTTGILHKKEGKFKVITPEGSYNVLDASIEHFQGEVGDEVILQLPAGNLTTAWGAVESIQKKGETKAEGEEKKEAPKEAPKPQPKPAARAPQPQPKPQVRFEQPRPKPAPFKGKRPDRRPQGKRPTSAATAPKASVAPAQPVVLGEDDLR